MKKLKAAIVTITNSNDNYGNVFQNFALQEFLKDIGFEVRTIRNYSFAKRRIGGLYLIPKLLINRKAGCKSIRFMFFKWKRIKYSTEIVTESTKNYSRLREKYDYFFCGSDQIWNPMYSFNRNWEYGLLRFANPRQKIAFSVSFGMPELQVSDQKIFSGDLNSFAGISVREKSGCDIVKTVSGRNATLLLDPAMLMSKRRWSKIEKPVKRLMGKEFLCVYMLGTKNEFVLQYIDSVIKENNCILVDITDAESDYYYPSPEKFLWIIHNSSYVATDSFHCTLFSILYGKQFKVFRREGQSHDTFDRIETLLGKFGLEKNIYDSMCPDCDSKNTISVEAILKKERNKARNFVLNSIGQKEEIR